MTFKEFVDSRGIKQSWIAEKIGVTPQIVNKWYLGERNPSRTNRLKMAKLFNMPEIEIYKIFFGEDAKHTVSNEHSA